MAKQPKGKRNEPARAKHDGEVTAVTTVVGGQPARKAKATMRVPIGIEKVLYLAASDAKFRSALLADRAAAVARSGVKLNDIERATLLGVPGPALEAMIARISPQRHGKRSFMRTVAAATVSLAAGVAAAGCNQDDRDPDIGGDHADAVEDTADVEPPDATRGATADVPDAVDIAEPPDYAAGGVMPDSDIDPGIDI
jgi:hypothetical protein